ncbi:MAG: nitroreductase family protein [Candidatus Adiutrix sp.]|nr:nitroreductase family protein [Candidatus Adiutrix sp.]
MKSKTDYCQRLYVPVYGQKPGVIHAARLKEKTINPKPEREVMNETLRVIAQRRSCKKFLPDSPDEAAVRAIVEAGRAAPSARGRQSRFFAVVRNKQLLDELNSAVKDVAKTLDDEYLHQQGHNADYNAFYHAPILIIVAGDGNKSMVEADCAAANQNMLIAAESLGLGACWINFTLFIFEGQHAEAFRKKLGIPEGYKVYCSVVVGSKAIARSEKKTIQGNDVHFFD